MQRCLNTFRRPVMGAVLIVVATLLTAGYAERLSADCVADQASGGAENGEVDNAACCECMSPVADKAVVVKTSLGSEQICVLPQDDIWVVATRQSCEAGEAETGFNARRLVCRDWSDEGMASLASDHRSDLSHMTVVLVHGNNTDANWALTRGMQFYDRVFGQHPCGRPPIRLVILSWESKRVLARPLPDYRLKAARAVSLGPSVACALNELGGSRPVLIGYSLGAQVVLSTLTQLSYEETVACRCRPGHYVALIAPALESGYACDCLGSIRNNPRIEKAEVFVNRHDRVVCAARLINRKRCDDLCAEPSLIGMADRGQLDATRFQLTDVTPEVRNRHSLVNYVASTTLGCHIRSLTLAAEAAATGADKLELAAKR